MRRIISIITSLVMLLSSLCIVYAGKADRNEAYLKTNIPTSENVTGLTSYSGKGKYIYTKDSMDGEKIATWIKENMESSDTSGNVFAVNTPSIIKDIKFEDEEKDYSSTSPNRGQKRRFQINHEPSVFENPDPLIANNNAIILEENFNTFDNTPVEKTGDIVTLTFSKAGKYELDIIEDDVIKNPANVDFSLPSASARAIIYAHREPFAIAGYDELDINKIKLKSLSYDPDFYSKSNKGISNEQWEYRELDYEGNILNDWTTLSTMNKDDFTIDGSIKTQFKLKVTDIGAFADTDSGDLNLSSEVIFDPFASDIPEVLLDILVTNQAESSTPVPSNNILYTGNLGHENIVLRENITWFDLGVTSGSRSLLWNIDRSTFNITSEAQTDLRNKTSNVAAKKSYPISLTATNKKGKSISNNTNLAIKGIEINPTGDKFFQAGGNMDFSIELNSPDTISNWGDLEVQVVSSDINFGNPITLINTTASTFEKSHEVPHNLASFNYDVNVYSKRTGDLLTSDEGLLATAITDLKIKAEISDKHPHLELTQGAFFKLREGQMFELKNIETECLIDVSNVKGGIYEKGTDVLVYDFSDLHRGIANGSITNWDNVLTADPLLLLSGNYDIKLIATAENGAEVIWTHPLEIIEAALDMQLELNAIVPYPSVYNFDVDTVGIPASEDIDATVTITTEIDITNVDIQLDNNSILSLAKQPTATNTAIWKGVYTVSQTTKDKTYVLTATATKFNGAKIIQTAQVKINTPIELEPNIDNTLYNGNNTRIVATTMKYANKVQVVAFKGTSYEETLDLGYTDLEGKKDWFENYIIPLNIPEGIYNFEFIATTSNENKEIKTIAVNVIGLHLSDFRILDIVNHYEDPFDYTYPIQKDDLPVDYKTGYMITFAINAKGNPDKVDAYISFSEKGTTEQQIHLTNVISSGSETVWQGEFYTDVDTPIGTEIFVELEAIKGVTIYDYNTKESWSGYILDVVGNALGDARINRTN